MRKSKEIKDRHVSNEHFDYLSYQKENEKEL